MITVKNDLSSIEASSYALSIITISLGLPSEGGSPGRRSALVLSYGRDRPRPESGLVLHIPAGENWWRSRKRPPLTKPSYRWSGDRSIVFSEDCVYPFYYYLTAKEDAQDLSPHPGTETRTGGGNGIGSPLNEYLESIKKAVEEALHRQDLPHLYPAAWPNGEKLALFLTHDVDQIHDRELFRILADINHLRMTLTGKCKGSVPLCLSRMARSLLRPKAPLEDFRTLLDLERRHGFRSTFFLLEDRYWARHGSRYRFSDPETKRIADFIKDRGGELGVHGGFYSFNDPEAYKRSMRSFQANFGFTPRGVRNHLLRFSHPQTWRAHDEAGFLYDTTFGYADKPGFRARFAHPFAVFDDDRKKTLELTELPLVVMDGTLFRHMSLTRERARETVEGIIASSRKHGGLLTLLWHNNYFNEPEYASWQELYAELLCRIAELKPYCATGSEIASWWKKRRRVRIVTEEWAPGFWRGHLESPEAIRDLSLVVALPPRVPRIKVEGIPHTMTRGPRSARITFKSLHPRDRVEITFNGKEKK